jgi:hypothetical protein
MRKSNSHTKNPKSNIQCVEVLIPKNFIVNSGHNLHWTLSVYSLENQPVRKSRSIHNSEIFHFMVYDWKRTIKKLLEDQKIPYSIIQYFSPETIYTGAVKEHPCVSDQEAELLSELKSIADPGEDVLAKMRGIYSADTLGHAALILEEKNH